MQAWPTDFTEPFTRDPGGLALLPLAIWWLVVLGWVATTDRLSRDVGGRSLDAGTWGMILAFPFVAAALVAWWIPWFPVGLVLMLLAWWGPIIAYARVRNAGGVAEESILTPAHARRLLAAGLGRYGIDLADEKQKNALLLPSLAIAADPAAAADEQSRRQAAFSAMPGAADAARFLAEASGVNATSVLFEIVGDAIAVREEIDGVWHPRRVWTEKRQRRKRIEVCVEPPPLPRKKADAIRDAMLAACGIDHRAPRPKRSGRFVMKLDGKPWLARLSTRASASAERIAVRWSPQAVPFKTLADLGMSDSVAERLAGQLALEKGLVIVTAPASSGGSTSFEVVMQSTDRLVRNFVSVEESAAGMREIQNVKPYLFDEKEGVSPSQALETALREYPQVLVSPDLVDAPLAGGLVACAESEQLVIVGMRADSAIDGIESLLKLGADRRKLAASLLGVLSQRLVRKLCPKCRQERPTPPELLTKLRLTAEQLPQIFQASKEGCRLCHGTGFRGRTAVFEFASGPTVCLAIAESADRATLQKAAVKDGMRPLADAAMRMVVDGTTSLEEMQRVLKPAAAATKKGDSR